MNLCSFQRRESKLINKYSKCCIDTSDGLFNALNTISTQSNTGYEITNIPYVNLGLATSKLFSLPIELLFLCEFSKLLLLKYASIHGLTAIPNDNKIVTTNILFLCVFIVIFYHIWYIILFNVLIGYKYYETT